VVDQGGRPLGRGEAPGSVVRVDEPEGAAEAVARAVSRAVERAGVSLPAETLWAGLAGAGSAAARDAVTEALTGRGLASRVIVGTDVEAAFHDAFGSGPGILLIAGTGSITLARDQQGTSYRVGGWGRDIGDEGSGFRLGAEALRRVMQAFDGRGEPTGLEEVVLGALGVAEAPDLVDWASRATKGDVAALAPLVVGSADLGDPAADAIVDETVQALELHVRAALRRLGAHGSGPEGIEVVLWGGLLGRDGPLRGRVLQALESIPIAVSPRELDPPMGAARLALASRDL
jgi:N-acetylglucosamine kinase-like BadF-type ATPase